jgi:DNA-binding transcriptional MerR regulator
MDKSPDAFRTISEVAEDLDVPQHVLRFWETRFTPIRPLKRGGGRRYYRPDDVELLKGIRHLLYGEGYTIRGVQRILKEEGVRFVQSVGRGELSVAAPDLGEQEDPYQDRSDHASPTPSAAPSLVLDDDRAKPSPDGNSDMTALRKSDIRLLQTALDSLMECDRVLSLLKSGPDPVPQE